MENKTKDIKKNIPQKNNEDFKKLLIEEQTLKDNIKIKELQKNIKELKEKEEELNDFKLPPKNKLIDSESDKIKKDQEIIKECLDILKKIH